jgi:metal-dependent amidase/aminoacylase/carboxypeptidase family protein
VTLIQDIRQGVRQMTGELVQLRRTIHQHPELAFEERATAELVASTLRRCGIPVEQGAGKTGVVALIEGTRPGRTIAVRTDMDCLPIHEETNLSFASQHAGKMHACGHDLHTAIGIGVAHLLHDLRRELKGRELAYTRGIAMASSDTFAVSLKGVSGHAALPHNAVDVIAAASYFITQLQTIVSREVDPAKPAVVTVGQIAAGTAPNILPDRLALSGTVRTLDSQARDHIEIAMRRLLDGLKTGMRVEYELEYRQQVPVLRNDDKLLDRVVASAREMLGHEKVYELSEATMGSEDFACYTEHVPGAYLRLGSMIDGRRDMLHNSDFRPNEDAIPIGVQVVTGAVVDLLT